MPMTYNSMGPCQGGSTSLEDIARDALPFCTWSHTALEQQQQQQQSGPAPELLSGECGILCREDFSMQPADRVHTFHVLPTTASTAANAQAGLCHLASVPINPLDTLVHW